MKTKKTAETDNSVNWLLDFLVEGDLDSILKHHTKSTNITETKVKAIARTLRNYIEALDGISTGDYGRRLPTFSHKDQIGNSISRAIQSVSETAKVATDIKVALESEKNKLIQEDWLKSKYTSIFSKIQGINTVSELGDIVLSELAFSINAQMGAFFVKEKKESNAALFDSPTEASINLIATYGTTLDSRKKIFALGEGIIGQAALDLKTRYYEETPAGFINIESGLGSIQPRSVAIIPITYEDELYGVLELASMDKFSDIQKLLLTQIASNIGISIKSITGNMLTEKLLDAIAKSNNTLASQKQALDYSAIVAETDTKGKITYVNDKFLQISKYTREELLGQDHRILNSRFHPKEFFINLWKTIAKGDVWHEEVKNKAKDGTFYWVDTTIYPVKDGQGKLQKYVAIRFDITDKKRAFEDLQVATQQAKNAAKVKTEFLANMSHEIRTPMNAIIGMGEILKETPLNVDQERYVNILNNSGSALLDVINNILDLSKLESGHLDLENIPFDIEDLVYSTTDIMGRSAHKKGLELIASIEPDLNTNIIGDPSRLRQVLINLIGNAIKFTKQGEVQLRIEENKAMPGTITFTVSDTGIGIPEEKLDSLFKNFSQANTTTTREYGGTGLGLAISKKIVEVMGGTIGVKSVANKGSSFYFSIPYIKYATTVVQQIEVGQLSGKTALIVDDNLSNQLVLKEMLMSWKMFTEEATSGATAIDKVTNSLEASKPYDLIILDYHMPHMNGIDTAKELARLSSHKSTTIVMLTSEDRRSKIGYTRNLGISSFVVKPIRRNQFLQIILNTMKLTKIRPKVLIVDDDLDIIDIITSSLQELNVTILTAVNGKDAEEMIQKNHIELVISDLNMPDVDGYELLKAVRKNGMQMPFIFLSGHLTQHNHDLGNELGQVEYLDKPCDMSVLLDLTDKYLFRSVSPAVEPLNLTPMADHTIPLRILIVDDVRDNIDLIQIYLKGFPYVIDTANNGQEAVDRFLNAKYNLIFMDIQMPLMDGHEATRKIRKIEAEKGLVRTPIVSLSAHALHEEKQSSLEAGADGYLTKPIKKQPLIEAIDQYSDHNKLEDIPKAS